MIIELFILMEIIMVGTFFAAFFTKHEILWGMTAFISGVLMITSYNIQIGRYIFNATTGAYMFKLVSYSFPFMMGINMLFFGLALLLVMFDLFDKYGISIGNFKSKVKK